MCELLDSRDFILNFFYQTHLSYHSTWHGELPILPTSSLATTFILSTVPGIYILEGNKRSRDRSWKEYMKDFQKNQ